MFNNGEITKQISTLGHSSEIQVQELDVCNDSRCSIGVSVVIPLYNKENEIERAIVSVLIQTHTNFELIVVDDGSTDNSSNLVRKFTDSRIHYIYQKNKGVSSARNTGIELARHDIVAFLDADDEWHSGFLKEIVKLYYDYPEAGIYATAFELLYLKSKMVPKIYVSSKNDSTTLILEDYFKSCVISRIMPLSSSSYAVKKSIVKMFGCYNVESCYSEDQELWGKMVISGVKIAYSKNILSTIHVVSSNKSTDKFYSLDHLPFVNYVHSNMIRKEMSTCQSEYLPLYIEFLELNTAYRNIGFGDMDRAINNLSNIHSKEFFLMKILFYTLAKLPLNIGKIVPLCYVHVRKLVRIKW